MAVERLGESLTALVPALGMYTCNDHADDAPEYDVWIASEGGRVIKLRSTSNCPQMLPWNVTADRKLYASYNPELGRAVFALHGRRPGPAVPSRGLRPTPDWVRNDEVTQHTLFRALESEMTRLLGAGRSTVEVDLHTAHLVTALKWMDEAGFKAWLRRLSSRPDAPPAVRRHAAYMLRALQ